MLIADPKLGRRADDGDRTRDLHLGKVPRYQLRHIHVEPTTSDQLAACLPGAATPPHAPARGGDRGLTVPRSARAAGGHRQPWSLHRGSNSGPRPYQGRARPTELWRRYIHGWRASPEPDSNRRHSPYKGDALARLSYRGLLQRFSPPMRRPGAPSCEARRIVPLLRCPERIRTSTVLIQNQVSCQLDHRAIGACTVRRPAASPGFEPELGEPKSPVLPVTPRGIVVAPAGVEPARP